MAGIVLVALSTLTGCSGEMSRAEACSVMAERSALPAENAGDRYKELTEQLATSAPEPMRGYVIATRDYRLPPLKAGEPIPDINETWAEIAEQHGFDRAIFCSS